MEQLKVIGTEDDRLVLATESGETILARRRRRAARRAAQGAAGARRRRAGGRARARARSRPTSAPGCRPRRSPSCSAPASRTSPASRDPCWPSGSTSSDRRWPCPCCSAANSSGDGAAHVRLAPCARSWPRPARRGERWTSWKEPTGWIVKLEFTANDIDHDARWGFDPRRSTLSPLNADAIQLSRQGSLPDGLIPRLRALEIGAAEGRLPLRQRRLRPARVFPTPTSSPPTSPRPPPPPSRRPRSSGPASTVVTSAETADLLEALRRRRGQREPLPGRRRGRAVARPLPRRAVRRAGARLRRDSRRRRADEPDVRRRARRRSPRPAGARAARRCRRGTRSSSAPAPTTEPRPPQANAPSRMSGTIRSSAVSEPCWPTIFCGALVGEAIVVVRDARRAATMHVADPRGAPPASTGPKSPAPTASARESTHDRDDSAARQRVEHGIRFARLGVEVQHPRLAADVADASTQASPSREEDVPMPRHVDHAVIGGDDRAGAAGESVGERCGPRHPPAPAPPPTRRTASRACGRSRRDRARTGRRRTPGCRAARSAAMLDALGEVVGAVELGAAHASRA